MIDVIGYSLDEAIDIIHRHKPETVYNIKVYTAPLYSHDNGNVNLEKRVIRQRCDHDNIIELTVSYFKGMGGSTHP